MPDTADARLRAFSRFIRKVVDEQIAMGVRVDEIESKTGVAKTTFYLWIKQEIKNPQPEQVKRFARALGVPEAIGPTILGWTGEPVPTDLDPATDPDIHAVMRRLHDPKVAAEEKTAIRVMLRWLARGGAKEAA